MSNVIRRTSYTRVDRLQRTQPSPPRACISATVSTVQWLCRDCTVWLHSL